MRDFSHLLDGRLALAALYHLEQLGVAGTLRGLPDERPGHVALGGHEVQVVEVAQQAERPLARALEERGVEPLWLVGRVLAIALRERPERLGVTVALSTNSADGRYCFVSFSGDDAVSAISYDTEREVARIPVGDHPQRMRTGKLQAGILGTKKR